MKKFLLILLVMATVVPTFTLPVGAAERLSVEDNNKQISLRAKELEQKYGITITYPDDSDGYASITMNNLETLDLAFSNLTPSVVRQVSDYYKKRNGYKINIIYVFSDSGYQTNGGVLMAAFERATSKIFVFLPKTGGRAIISGENPIALVHEFGHAFHLMCIDYYGAEKMRGEWANFNGGYRYNPNMGFINPDENIFISGYSTTSFEEDFAEVFSHTFVRTAAGTGFKSHLGDGSKMTGLGGKVNYVERMLSKYLADTRDAIQNYRRIYSTSSGTTFEGQKFSGEYLQYIGYPQPKNILPGILKGLRLTSQKSTWVRKLGAWRVVADSGKTYFIFPGGTWMSADGSGAA